ncbi:TlpA family protein disulfide reductase [Fulvivirgaceae bacterium PWU4]|uniref:TlpA family protein disulfide reductase n=1 Tax=Chryseosolibacter histidini TaxID=2782349 RepID=A0AAP2DTR7_9BACT|nr:TlpA disulfide reductase family protein [Chryseosolibacter histidini]MBT1701072.1 TlpA family protein disulfide reductase [Chryseosolibacter histidini]
MKKNIIAMIMSCVVFGAAAQKAEVVKLDKLQQIMETKSDKIRVINFWATWCAPCIKELPLFEKLHAERSDVKVTLVSMDLDLDPNPEKVYKFLDRKKLQSEVLLLNEQNANSWIGKIDKSWSGALPATIVINPKTGQRKFIERQLHEGDLEKLIAEVQ